MALCASLVAPARARALPPDFVVENAAPGAAFSVPVAVAFLPDGRMLVAEKRGVVWVVHDGIKDPTPFWNGFFEVLDNGDRGLLDVAVDPHYFQNHYIYLLYVVDPDSNLTDDNDDAFGRLTRYQVGFTDSSTVDPSTRQVLIGATWSTGFPSGSASHSVGSLRFAPDGTLLVSCGDGAQYTVTDQGGLDPGLFLPGRIDPGQDIGAFRARWVGSLSGKILRVDPATGLGLPSNPYFDGNPASNRSRVWEYGMRNPFRYALKPGTGSTDPALGEPGTLYIGDVGWSTWEEIDVARDGGLNLGWPCVEGPLPEPSYQVATPARGGCDSSGTFNDPAAETAPIVYWHHTNPDLSSPPGFIGNTSIGGVFYTGSIYPPAWRGRYFFADYAADWMRSMVVDSLDHPVQVELFGDGLGGAVDVEADPISGDLVYVSIFTSEVRRIRYVGTENNSPPVAVAGAYPQAGPSPLTVSFSAASSSDPEGDPLTYNWLFGDGYGSTQRDPRHTYAAQGLYQAVLSVSDGRGGIGRDTVEIVADLTDFPTTPVLDAFDRADGPLGKSWKDELGTLAISSGAVVPTSPAGDAIWIRGTFGAEQEAFFTLANPSSGTGAMHDLYLAVQGDSRDQGCVRARYDAWAGEVSIQSYTPAEGWQPRGGPAPALLLPGDQLGAKVSPDGSVVVFRNGEGLLIGSIAGTTLQGAGGGIGLGLENAPGARLDDFGGGDYLAPNTPPELSILSPADHSFFVAGDSLHLRCTALDVQDSAAAMQYQWVVDLHHNNHVHPAIFTASGAQAVLLAENHDDGTGVWYAVHATVTDRGGLTDTASVSLYPEVDLWPSAPTTLPHQPGTLASATYTFTLHNSGRMPAPLSRWRLRAGAALLAEGDTLVAPMDSVVIRRVLPPVLEPGGYTLRATADSLGGVPETDETNNAAVSDLTVVFGYGSDDFPPAFVYGPVVAPTGVTAFIRWRTNELARGRLDWGANPALGDSVPLAADTVQTVRLQNLTSGATYHYQVTAIDLFGNETVTAPDSFTTLTGTLAASDPPLRFSLSGARPNPTSGRVMLALELPERRRVEMRVLDIAGREVWHAPPRPWEPGRWSLEWPGAASAPPGLYLARVTVDDRAFVRRIVVVR